MFNPFAKSKKKQPSTPRELQKRVMELEEQLNKVSQELEVFQRDMREAFTKIGMVRFNPFGEIGGDQSFSVSLLNQEDTGIVITSHYGKEMNRMYAKPVKRGTSEYQLSEEEQQAIKKAMAPMSNF